MPGRLIMLGTAPATRGGISAVVNAYRAYGWFERWQAEYVATHCDGPPALKAIAALRALARFAWLLARDGRAVVHVHSASRASFWRKCAFLSIGLIAGCPILLHLHGGGFRRFYEEECGPLRRRLVRFFLDRAACILVLSESARAWIRTVTRNPRVVCIPNPVPAGNEIKYLKNGVGPHFLLFAGRIERDKGVFDLLEAFCAVRRSVPGLELVCAGEGDRDALARRAAQLGVQDALHLPGWVDAGAMRYLLERAAAFVLPSHVENQPMSLLEAMSMGTPVVATSVGAIPELVTHRATGYLVAPGDTVALEECLRQVVLDRSASARMAQSARALVLDRHGPERVMGLLATAYRDAGLAPREAARPVVLLLGPSRAAVSGVSTHLNLLIESSLGGDYELAHFQVGSEGRDESAARRWLRLATSPLALALAIVRERASVVHLNTSLNPRAYWRDLAYLLVAKVCGARAVYQVHGGELPQRFLGAGLGAAFLRATLRIPDAIVVLASGELSAYRAFVPRQTIAMLPNGIDCAPYARPPRPCTHPTRPLELLYLGRIAAEKGLYATLKGLSVARARGVCARLVIAGGGPERARLERYAEELGISGHVWFSGPVAGARKARLFRQADAIVLPSYSEGLPYALLEGMAAGAPPIATPVGAIADVVAHGVHGLLVPPRDANAIADAIARLAQDRAALARMSAACRTRIASAYSIERLAGDLGSLYAELGAAPVKALRGG